MEKQAELSTGGYDYQFVETPPDKLICKICQFPSREPFLSECCGHTFCKSCIDYAKKATLYYPFLCPVCRSENFPLFRNKQNERDIKSLYVFCSNKERGCEWQGELNNINDHLKNNDGCPFEEVACSNNCENVLQRKFLNGHLINDCPRRKSDCQYCHITDEFRYIEGSHMEKCPKYPLPCPNDCGISDIPREGVDDHQKLCPLEEVECSNHCGVSMQRQYLQGHIKNECPRREVNCQHCQILGEQQFIEGEHEEMCPKYPLVCPNKCEAKNVLREDMQAHKKECPLEMVQCQYSTVGCNTMIVRKNLLKHNQEKMEEHLSFTMSELVSTRDELTATKQCLLSTKQQLACTIENNIQQLKFAEKRLDDSEQQLALTKIRLNGNERRLNDNEQRLDDNQQRLDDNELRLDDNEQRLSTNEDQLAEAEQQLEFKTDDVMERLQGEIEEIEQRLRLEMDRKLQQTMKQVQWTVHLNTRANNDDQTFPAIIKLSEFERMKDDDDYWFSDTFYTHKDGYNLQLKVFPNGNDVGEGTHVSVYLYMEEGDDDDKLTWPMKKMLRVRLLNQISDSQHHSEMHSITAKRTATHCDRWIWYAHKFIPHFDLLYYSTADRKFLLNDCLIFEVSEV